MARTVTQIIDRTSFLELYFSATDKVEILKTDIKLRLSGNYVFLYDKSLSRTVPHEGEQQQYRLNYQVITAPVAANAGALLVAIYGMINTGGAVPVGGATAANQLLQLAQETDINLNTADTATNTANSTLRLSSIDNKIPAAPATAGNQQDIITQLEDFGTADTIAFNLAYIKDRALSIQQNTYAEYTSQKNIYVLHEDFGPEATLADLNTAMRAWQIVGGNQNYPIVNIDRQYDGTDWWGTISYSTYVI